MNLYIKELRVMRMLEALKGGYLGVDGYHEAVGKRLERSNFPLSRAEVSALARDLERKGLVASIFERLDGVLIALTAEGRRAMETEGAVFDQASVEKTRALFREWLCKADM